MNYASPFTGADNMMSTFWETSPDVAYQSWMGAQGASPQSNRNYYNFGKTMNDWYGNDYLNQSIKEPGLKWTGYLDRMGSSGQSLDSMWGNLSPQARGERNSNFAAPVRWV